MEMTPQLAAGIQNIVCEVEGLTNHFKTKCALTGLPPTKTVFFSYLDGMHKRRPEIFTDDTCYVIKIVVETYNFFAI